MKIRDFVALRLETADAALRACLKLREKERAVTVLARKPSRPLRGWTVWTDARQ